MAGVAVSFSTGNGGVLGSASGTTDVNGSGSSGTWTVGQTKGQQRLTATVVSNTSLTASVSATARYPYWTVLVYVAADNNLSSTGLQNIDQIEAAGVDPEVQVMIQADVNPTELQVAGCGGPQGCVNRPNYNSFRYKWAGLGTPHMGPNGPTIDLGGNIDFSSSATLHDFVQWGTQAAPAEHYALILWNHGGGYQGLLQDVSTAGGKLMLPGQLPQALAGTPHLDVLEFDMCLMGQYETMTVTKGLTDNVVFSQEVESAPGQHYQLLMQGLYANHRGDGRVFATTMADRFSEGFQDNPRASVTVSAYSLSGLSAFETALNSLADSLRVHVGTVGLAVSSAAAASQKFTFAQFTDIVNFVDSLAVRTTDPVLLSQLAAVRAATVEPSFRLRNHVQTAATSDGAVGRDVSRANGLAITLPSELGEDQFDATGGALSLASYTAQFGASRWAQFLTAYASGASGLPIHDQGASRLEIYLAWDTASVRLGSDLDLWVLEPNGNLYAPFVGTVTPDGVFTQDSHLTGTFYEGYLTNRVLLAGTYKFYASLWLDPANVSSVVDIQYRTNPAAPLTSLYAPTYPSLSRLTAWKNDHAFSMAKADAGTYTDLRPVANATFAATSGAATAVAGRSSGTSPVLVAGASALGPELTPAQIAVLRQFAATRPVNRQLSPVRQPDRGVLSPVRPIQPTEIPKREQ